MKVHSNKTPTLVCNGETFLKMFKEIHKCPSVDPEADNAAEQACLNAGGEKTCEEWEDLYRGTWEDFNYPEDGPL